MSSTDSSQRVLSGMRPTGKLHLGHYHGVLKNWINLQNQHECYFFVADWHALTTHYDDPRILEKNVYDMVIDWLAVGVDPQKAAMFIQSQIPEHAELHLLLSMITPLGWLERVPSFKDQQDKIKDKDLQTYGFLGYPLLQSADILMYKAGAVPVGADQVAHVEITREIARRFNHMFGKEPDFEERAQTVIRKMSKQASKQYKSLCKAYQEQGSQEALESGRELLSAQQNLSTSDRERLQGYLEGSGKIILVEPQALLTPASKMPGLDGQKMSKSYNNTIALREPIDEISKKISKMPTDPARVRLTDPGEPKNCPVWQLHEVYSDAATQQWAEQGCRSAGIGCLECKRPVIDAVVAELEPIQVRASEYEKNPDAVKAVIAAGNDAARATAAQTMDDVRQAMGLKYR